MRILWFVLIFAFFLLWAAAAFFSSHVSLWNALLFLFVKALVIQVALLCRNMLYCGALSSSHLPLQLYSLWRLSELCSCRGRLGRESFPLCCSGLSHISHTCLYKPVHRDRAYDCIRTDDYIAGTHLCLWKDW